MTNKKMIALLLISLVFIAAKSDKPSEPVKSNSYSYGGYDNQAAEPVVASKPVARAAATPEVQDPRAAAISALAKNPQAIKAMLKIAKAMETSNTTAGAAQPKTVEAPKKAEEEKTRFW